MSPGRSSGCGSIPSGAGSGWAVACSARWRTGPDVLGCATLVLDTNESLDEAIAMYERAGYSRIERYNDNPYAHHWFGKSVDTV